MPFYHMIIFDRKEEELNTLTVGMLVSVSTDDSLPIESGNGSSNQHNETRPQIGFMRVASVCVSRR